MSAPRFDPTLLYGRSDFGEFESRLRRLMALEGLVPLDLGRTITPVAIMGDSTEPGFGSSRLRRFHAQQAQGGIGTGYWWKAESAEGVIVDEVRVILTTAGVVRMRYLGPQDPDPVVIAIAGGVMIDRASSGSEVTPLLRSAVQDGSAVVSSNQIFDSNLNLPVGMHVIMNQPFYMVNGSKISCGGTQAVAVSIRGRTF